MVCRLFLSLIGEKMGTNFYLTSEPCKYCGRTGGALHIGKSSAGWAFALRVYPEDGIANLDDWKKKFQQTHCQIIDEYGHELNYDQMIEKIENRSHPNGLNRSIVDGNRCIGNGEGTYDYYVNEFS